MSRLGSSTFSVLIAILLTNFAHSAEQIDLSPGDRSNDLSRVTIKFEAGGHNLISKEADENTLKASTAKEEEQRIAISVSAKLAYDELRLPTSADPPTEGTALAVRYYDEADAVIKVDTTGRTPRLAEDRRLIVLEHAVPRPGLYSPDGPLTREQLDLVDVVGNSFVVDGLLPTNPVAEGDTWASDATVLGQLLTLDSVAVCEVQSILEGFNADFAKVRVAGMVHGNEDGAATQQEVRGVYLFDRHLRRITRINLAIRVKRSIGGATPGLEAVAKLEITIDPLKESAHLTGDVISKVAGQATPSRELLFEAGALGFRFRHDRQWFMASEQREAISLRRIDRDDLVAQCTLTSLTPKSAGRQATLEQFQKDITFSLGKSFGELVSSRQWQNAAGHYCYEVVVRGLVEDLPVEWHYYLVAPESGHRVSIAVTIEKPMIERVAGADRQLVESLELFPPVPVAKTAAAETPDSKR
jgi:hypothetical protein